MKKYTLSILSLSLLLSSSVFNTSCSSESDDVFEIKTKVATGSNVETLEGSMWKEEGPNAGLYIQFNNGFFAWGSNLTNPITISKYFLEDGNIILQTNIGYNVIPYSFEDGKLVVIQNNSREVYSYVGKALDITNDFTNYETLYRSNWSTSLNINNKNVHLTVKFLDNGEFKYSFAENWNPWEVITNFDKTGIYRIERDQIYMNWNDGKSETVQTISLQGGTLTLSYPEGSGKADMSFYQS